MKVDVLYVGAHPDDVELACGGTISKLVEEGKSVGIADLTLGELGTRGTPELRRSEAEDAANILGVNHRINLELSDGFISESDMAIEKIISAIRLFAPEIIVINAVSDRHPDHGIAFELTKRATFLSGLNNIRTYWDNELQEAHRPKTVLSYIQNDYLEPDFVIDVTAYWDQKLKAVSAYKSQFFNPNSGEPETHISSKRFFDFLSARGMEFGDKIGVTYAEGYQVHGTLNLSSLSDLI